MARFDAPYPGVFVTEDETAAPGFVSDVTRGSFIGQARKGNDTKAILCDSYRTFVQNYGDVYQGNYLAHAVRMFFQEGGTSCYVVRVTASDSAAASSPIAAIEDSAKAADIVARWDGAYGNDIYIRTQVKHTYLTTAFTDADTSHQDVVLADASGISVGDVLVLYDGTQTLGQVVRSVTHSTNTVSLMTDSGAATGADVVNNNPAIPATFAVNSRVMVPHKHRYSGGITANMATGASSVELTHTAGLVRGQVLLFCYTDATNAEWEAQIVDTIAGNTVTFMTSAGASATTGLATTFTPDKTVVVSVEYNMNVYEKSGGAVALLETHEFLANQSLNTRDYVGTRLSGDTNESNEVVYTIATVAGSNLLSETPLGEYSEHYDSDQDGSNDAFRFVDLQLSTDTLTIGTEVTGSDGTVANIVYNGSSSAATGQYALDDKNIDLMSIPGISDTGVVRSGMGYCAGRGDCLYVADHASSDTTVGDIIQYRYDELSFDSSYASLYSPWYYISDPSQNNALVLMPPSGAAQGIITNTIAKRGPHKAPANVNVSTAVKLAYEASAIEHGDLNDAGINVIRKDASGAIKLLGARTLATVKDGKHFVSTRMLLNHVKNRLKGLFAGIPFEPNDTALWSEVQNTARNLLKDMWRQGMLSPSNDFALAAFAKCDAETNPTSETLAGRVNLVIGVQPPFPAEKVIVSVSLLGNSVIGFGEGAATG